MKKIKLIFLISLCLLFAIGLSVTAFAADASFVYTGHNLFSFSANQQFTYTDLFGNFKDVMPGDVLTETITVKNEAFCCDYVKIYVRAEVHGDDNSLSESVAALETVESMRDFLNQLSMTVNVGSRKIFDAAPSELDGMRNNVFLGNYRYDEESKITIRLTVPADLGNEYANRAGEVDWVFTVEEFDYEPWEIDPTETTESETDPSETDSPETDPPAADPDETATPDADVDETTSPDTEEVSPDTEPTESEPDGPVLPSTGVRWKPVPILALIGVLFIGIGFAIRKNGEK